MNVTVLIILSTLSLGMVICGLVMTVYGMIPRRTTRLTRVEPGQLSLIDPHVPPFPERPSLQQKLLSRPPNPLLIGLDGELVPRGQSNRALLKLMKTIEQEIEERDPPQSVSGIIPYGQAAGDYPDPEATYEERQFAPPDWKS